MPTGLVNGIWPNPYRKHVAYEIPIKHGSVHHLHGLPGFVHGLNVLLCFHPQSRNAGAAVHVIQRVLVIKCRGALVRRRWHGLHSLYHARGGVQEAGMTGISRLEALARPHEARDAVHRGGAGERRGQPRVQGKRITQRPHIRGHGWPIKGQHCRVMNLHGARVHLLLSPPFCTSVLEPHL